eukprot:m.102276 g.102276  ORF g.102276 m.102276 type:complete len:337 (+) comp27398_c0_seq2:196-1206(+)
MFNVTRRLRRVSLFHPLKQANLAVLTRCVQDQRSQPRALPPLRFLQSNPNLFLKMDASKGARVGLGRHVDWSDKTTPWDLLFSILKWCDGQAGNWFNAPNMPEAVSNLYTIWSKSSVTRLNSVQICVPNSEWPDTIEVEVWCSRVGNSTWDMSHTFTNNLNARPILLASAVTTLCAVDETLTKSRPVPDADKIKALTLEPPFRLNSDQTTIVRPATDSEIMYRGESTVRLVDTDALGHVNNAKYIYLVCDALTSAFAQDTPLVKVDVVEFLNSVNTMNLSYTGQMKPGMPYSYFVSIGPNGQVHCHFEHDNELMCAVTLCPYDTAHALGHSPSPRL